MLKRIDQIFSNFGFGSRKDALKAVRRDRIRIGDRIVTSTSEKAEPSEVFIDDAPLDHPNGIYIALNKPAGCVCTHTTAEGPTVYSLFPPQWLYRTPCIETIGRLDKDTTGIVLLTDEMALIHSLTSPKACVSKEYVVTVEQPLKESDIAVFASGTIMLHNDDKPCLPALLTINDPHTATIVITEGRFHQVKRMFAVVGYIVTSLHRVRVGAVLIGDLQEGTYRDCEPELFKG